MKRGIIFITLLGMILSVRVCLAGSEGASIMVVMPDDAPGPMLFGAGEIRAAVEAVEGTSQPGDDIEVIVLIQYATPADLYPQASAKLAELKDLPKESFMIIRLDDLKWLVTAPDPVGAMYGALDIAEQIELKGSYDFQEKIVTPFIEIRAVNPFLHVQAFDDPDSWYYSDEYWQGYLDTLARSRYNLLDIHSMYDLVSTLFPNCYLYLLHIDEYPDVGVSKEQAAKNLEQLRKVIAMAGERGIKVSLMSYHASWALSGRENELSEPTPDDKLADYTRLAVKEIINELPDLWMVGFRIGEGGRPATFFQDSYLKGIGEANRDIFLFTRSWVTPPKHVLAIADAYPGKTFIEIKYNGEHLGLPYHAMIQPWRMNDPSYSYESYTNWPRKYRIIWQIRANGTHRMFRWGDPEYAARTMRTVQFGAAAGFTLEPISSYYPPIDYFHAESSPFRIHEYEYQRNWFWYFLWGRTAYDPNTGQEVWLKEFEKRYGKEAAKPMFEALVHSSRIVPAIYSFHCLGPDHRNMAPEYETGGDLYEFIHTLPLDPNAFAETIRFVTRSLSGSAFAESKVTPLEVADYLEREAAAAVEAIGLVPQDLSEFARLEAEDMAVEIDMMRELAGYYAEKIRATVWFLFWRERTSLPDLDCAREHVLKAHEHWDRLAAMGEEHFIPFLDTLRMHTTQFTWREEGKDLGRDMEILDQAKLEFDGLIPAAGDPPRVFHRDIVRHALGDDLVMEATVIGSDVRSATLFLNALGQEDLLSFVMEKDEDAPVYRAVIPAASLRLGNYQYYIQADSDSGSVVYPEPASSGRIRKNKLLVTDDFSDPVITPRFLGWATDSKDQVIVTVEIEDRSDIHEAKLYWKPTPSIKTWEAAITMKPGTGGLYSAEVPITPEGLIFYIEAADRMLNAAHWPDVWKQTPYYVIPAWDPNGPPSDLSKLDFNDQGE